MCNGNAGEQKQSSLVLQTHQHWTSHNIKVTPYNIFLQSVAKSEEISLETTTCSASQVKMKIN